MSSHSHRFGAFYIKRDRLKTLECVRLVLGGIPKCDANVINMPKDEFTHIGWVPCISGHLFFEFTCCGLGRASLIVDVNNVERQSLNRDLWRYIIISSNVNWQDDKDKESTGLFKVVLAADVPIEGSCVCGSVYIFLAAVSSGTQENIDSILRKIKENTENRRPVAALYSTLTQQLAEKQAEGICRINFSLNRAGFVRLNLESLDPDRGFNNEILIRQAYYYIKYSWHKHQHHSDTAESLTTVHPLDLGGTHSDAFAMINDLKRALVQLKRDFHVSEYRSLYQAEGIATYAKSLILSARREQMLEDGDSKEQVSYFENVAKSVAVKIKVIEQELTTRSLISSNFRSILLFFLAVVAPISLVFREKIVSVAKSSGDTPAIAHLLGHLFGSGYKLLGMCLIWLTFYLAYRQLYLSFGSPLLAFRWIRDLLDRIVAGRYKADILSIMFMGGGMTIFFYWVYLLIDH